LTETWFAELSELIRIPSISADPERAGDVRAAGEWVSDFLRRAGASSEVAGWNGQPLVVAHLAASRDAAAAPTVLCYGHFDVQGVNPLELWESDPFELEIRGEWAYARGVADDKGGLYMLMKAAEQLAAAGELPVNLRFVCDGEEETLGTSIVEYLEADTDPADACIIFDTAMSARDLPTFSIGTRGNVIGQVRVRSGTRDLHSGGYGGAAMNAVHALHAALGAILPRDGVLPEAIRAGVIPPGADELADVARLARGADVLAAVGAPPADARAADQFHDRVRFQPTVEVIGITGGSPDVQKTIVASTAAARISMRLAAGQDPEEIRDAAERLMREAAPAGAALELEWSSATPAALFSTTAPAIRLGLDAFERVLGTRPLLQRGGGTLPIMPALAAKGIDTVLTGFSLPESQAHAPNERMLTGSFPLGIAAAKELYRAFAALPR
jgi:acetylornithine deacetylase/succinyl-diaminopimelate desuccinylase-like protein